MMQRTTYTARWVVPVSTPPIAHGTVTVRGSVIESVGLPGGAEVDLGDVAIIPGLVNAHTHLDLSGARGFIPPTTPERFTDWLRGVIGFRRQRTPQQVGEDVRAGLAECLAYGTTLIGDIGSTRFERSHGIAFREIIGLAPERFDAEVARLATGPYSLHAPYSVNAQRAMQLLNRGERVVMHVAECPGERELLEHRCGPFVPFLQSLGVYDESVLARSVEELIAAATGDLVMIHANGLPADFAFRANHHVVICPRTHEAFGHPRHPFPHWLARGVNVAIGTDSLASNPDLDVLAEARALSIRYPEVAPDVILRMATLNGAKVLGFGKVTGSLEPGKSADLAVIPISSGEREPIEAVLHSTGPRRRMWRGEWT